MDINNLALQDAPHMRPYLYFVAVFIVAAGFLLAAFAYMDHRSRQRELELTFIGVVSEKFQWETGLYGITVQDSIGPIQIERVHPQLLDFVEIGDTLIKKEGYRTCLVQNQVRHKHHVFEVYKH